MYKINRFIKLFIFLKSNIFILKMLYLRTDNIYRFFRENIDFTNMFPFNGSTTVKISPTSGNLFLISRILLITESSRIFSFPCLVKGLLLFGRSWLSRLFDWRFIRLRLSILNLSKKFIQDYMKKKLISFYLVTSA